ncbi:AAA family ATPase [Desulfobotulus mexicanus]|nr:AAA family ATPase [Desulfobotulus mexicanus]
MDKYCYVSHFGIIFTLFQIPYKDAWLDLNKKNYKFKFEEFGFNNMIISIYSSDLNTEFGLRSKPLFAWFQKNRNKGFDLFSFCSAILKKSTQNVANMLEEYIRNSKKVSASAYSQDVVPFDSCDQTNGYYFKGGNLKGSFEYLTSYDVLFQYVDYWILPSGEQYRLYYTLWRKSDGEDCRFVPIPPKKPYRLLNLNSISGYPEALIFFVKDEELAFGYSSGNPLTSSENRDPTVIFTTCFMGFAGIKNADLSPLEGMDVCLFLSENSLDVQYLPEAITNLKKARCAEVWVEFYGRELVQADEYLRSKGHGGKAQGLIGEAPVTKGLKTINNRRSGTKIKRKMLLDPIIKEGDLVVIYGEAKIGKSWLGYSMAYALGSGNQSIARWNSGDPARVLYVDGESYEDECKERIEKLMKAAGNTSEDYPFETFLRMEAADEDFGISLETEEWQNRIEGVLDNYDVFFFDSLYSLIKNDAYSAGLAFKWFRKLGMAGKTVIVLDHSNSEGEVQGGKVKGRAANLVMNVAVSPERSSRLKVSLPHARSLSPEDSVPFDLDMIFTEDAFGMEVVKQESRPLSETDRKVVLVKMLLEKDLTGLEAAGLVGVSDSSVSNYKKKAMPEMTEEQREELEKEAKGLYAKYQNEQKAVENDAKPTEK